MNHIRYFEDAWTVLSLFNPTETYGNAELYISVGSAIKTKACVDVAYSLCKDVHIDHYELLDIDDLLSILKIVIVLLLAWRKCRKALSGKAETFYNCTIFTQR